MKKSIYVFVLGVILSIGLTYCCGTAIHTGSIYASGVSGEMLQPLQSSLRKVAYPLTGTCGEQATWILTSEGTLTVSGSGAIRDYYYAEAPWTGFSDKIKRIVIQDGITSIGDRSFDSCENAKSVELPNSMIQIGEYAFQDCSSLISIIIPENLQRIEYGAFYHCTGLKAVEYLAIDCTISTGWEMPAFAQSQVLTTISLGPKVQVIPAYLFAECKAIQTVTIPQEIQRIDAYAFSGCTALSTVHYNAINGTVMSPYVFDGCTSLNSIVFGEDVKHIPSVLFQQCAFVQTLTIPETVESIGDNAFSNCKALTEVHYNAVNCSTEYVSSIFSGCENLKIVDIGAKVKSLPAIFSYCKQLEKIEIPDGVEVIENGAFQYCIALNDVSIPPSVHTIGNYAFDHCTALQTLYLPVSVNSIGYSAFRSCENLQMLLGEAGSYVSVYAGSERLRFLDRDFYQKWSGRGNIVSLSGTSSSLPNQYIYQYLTLLTKEQAQFLCITLRYHPEYLKLISSYSQEFQICNYSNPVQDKDGYLKVTVSAQYNSENGSWDANMPCIPNYLRFLVLPDTPIDKTSIEIVGKESYLITPDKKQIYFDGQMGSQLQVLPQRAEAVSISGPDHISAAASYQTVFNPYYTTDQRVKWTVGNPQIAEISEEGRLRPKQNGTTFLFVRTLDGSGKEAFFNVTVTDLMTPVQANSLTISGREEVDGIAQYTALLEPETVTNKNIAWSVDDEAVAQIDQYGVLHPYQNGKVTIIAAATDGSGLNAKLPVLVKTLPAELEGISSNVGTWYPAFHTGQYGYEIKIPYSQTGINLTSQFADGVLRYNDEIVASETPLQISMDGKSEKEIELRYEKSGFSPVVYHLRIRQEIQAVTSRTIAVMRDQTEEHTIGFDLYRLNEQYPDAVVFLAVYDKEGTMQAMTACSMGIDQLYQNRVALDTLKDDPKSYKLFVWDSVGGMRPIEKEQIGDLYHQ